MAVIWNTSGKNASFKLETANQCVFNCFCISFQNMQFFEFLVFVNYHINGLNQF